MKSKRIISILLVLASFVTLLVACGGEKKEAKEERPINPELISAFGEEMIEGEKETIESLVTGLEQCYKNHQNNNDVVAFAVSVRNAMMPYDGYLKEISDELMNLYEEAKAQGDRDKMNEYLSTYSSSIKYVADESLWSNYLFFVENNMAPTSTEEELETAVIEYINDISEFFYCEPIIK